MLRSLLFACALLPALACNPEVSTPDGCLSGCGNSDGGPSVSLTITPASATLYVEGGPGKQTFTARDKAGNDVTAAATWNVSPASVATVDKGVVTTAWPLASGSAATVTATYNNVLASATVDIVLRPPPVVDPSAPPDAPSSFGGAASTDSAQRPALIYPFDGAMLARNILQMNLQWTGSSQAALHRVHIVGATIDAMYYVGKTVCTGGTQCRYKLADKDWQSIARSAAGKPVQITVQSTAGTGQPVATSATVSVLFSPEDVKGGLYYFSTSARGIKRLPFGASAATDFIKNGNTTGCVGCHAVSRDGKKLAATFGGSDGYAGITDGANGQSYILPPDTTQTKYAWNFATFSPDGKQLITNWAGKLSLRDATTGALVKEIPQGFYNAKQAVMPEWSPDGEKIVFVGVPTEGFIGKDIATSSAVKAGDWILGNAGSIMVMPYNGGSFGMAQPIVPSVAQKEYNFYPSISPDSQWIVFATGRYPGNSPTAAQNGVNTTGKCMSYDQDTARLRLVRITGGPVIELTAATHVMDRTSSWPKFTPFVQNNGQLVFFTFSSKFSYGFIVPERSRPQIWMAGIDLARAAADPTADPSYPPFWLPFQDPTQNNHLTIWTSDVACASTSDCPSDFTCDKGVCVPKVG